MDVAHPPRVQLSTLAQPTGPLTCVDESRACVCVRTHGGRLRQLDPGMLNARRLSGGESCLISRENRGSECPRCETVRSPIWGADWAPDLGGPAWCRSNVETRFPPPSWKPPLYLLTTTTGGGSGALGATDPAPSGVRTTPGGRTPLQGRVPEGTPRGDGLKPSLPGPGERATPGASDPLPPGLGTFRSRPRSEANVSERSEGPSPLELRGTT
jgi:hypothetical protein